MVALPNKTLKDMMEKNGVNSISTLKIQTKKIGVIVLKILIMTK
jgi:ribosomal protein L25 (general stress protein Ctc)